MMHDQAQFKRPTGYRGMALTQLMDRRPFKRGSADWEYRTIAAWVYLQMAMDRASCDWTRTPPRVTVGAAQ